MLIPELLPESQSTSPCLRALAYEKILASPEKIINNIPYILLLLCYDIMDNQTRFCENRVSLLNGLKINKITEIKVQHKLVRFLKSLCL